MGYEWALIQGLRDCQNLDLGRDLILINYLLWIILKILNHSNKVIIKKMLWRRQRDTLSTPMIIRNSEKLLCKNKKIKTCLDEVTFKTKRNHLKLQLDFKTTIFQEWIIFQQFLGTKTQVNYILTIQIFRSKIAS